MSTIKVDTVKNYEAAVLYPRALYNDTCGDLANGLSAGDTVRVKKCRECGEIILYDDVCQRCGSTHPRRDTTFSGIFNVINNTRMAYLKVLESVATPPTPELALAA